jgi:hypothetical protein
MAVKNLKTKEAKVENKPEAREAITSSKMEGKWMGLGWVLLLFAGLSHMLPDQMAPILKWSLFGVSLQMAIGVVSVVLALNFLLED